jgi:ferrous iron transport protein B
MNDCCETTPTAPRTGHHVGAPRVAVVGNPNCGKTSLFNALTGSHQRVGNWPGVTVDRKEGFYHHDSQAFEVSDLPGVYTLGVAVGAGSIDERIARDYVASREADVVINILDATNLERNLYLTTQLVDMQVPMVLVLNMMDAAADQGLKIDIGALAARFGVPVVGIVATRGIGLDQLKAIIAAAVAARPVPRAIVAYPDAVNQAVGRIAQSVAAIAEARHWPTRWLALKLLEGDAALTAVVSEGQRAEAAAAIDEIAAALGEDADIIIADARYTAANDLMASAVSRPRQASRSMTDRIDAVVLNRFLGIPIFLVVMYAMFMFTVDFGGAFQDFFEGATSTLLIDGLGHGMAAVGLPAWLVTVVAKGAGGGIKTVSTFIPIIGALFLFLSVLEDTGYMARAAFVMDRFMKGLGLPGKSFVPMMVGFGCTVPAVMATRTLENQRDRVLTAVMSHFMSCGARLPVFAIFAAAFFPTGAQNVVFALYLIGIAFAVITGLLLKGTVLAGQSAPFLMELPLYHMPTARGVLIRTWERLKGFLFKAGKFIVAVAIVLTVLNSVGRDGSFGNENTSNSVLAAVGQSMMPVFEPMGVRPDNWPATVGLITGLFAKEVVVGTLDALYTRMADDQSTAAAKPDNFSVMNGLALAVATIPANLTVLADKILDPLGIDIAVNEAAGGKAVQRTSIGVMASHFDGKLGAFAYLMAILLYSPCMSALSAYYRELSPRWMAFVAIYATTLGYSFAVLTYQIGSFARHPAQASAWIAGVTALLLTGVAVLFFTGRQPPRLQPLPAE